MKALRGSKGVLGAAPVAWAGRSCMAAAWQPSLSQTNLAMERVWCRRQQALSCRLSHLIFSTPGVPPSPWALPDRCRARTPAGEVYGEGMKARVATVVGFVARLRCVEAGARGVAVWPHQRVSGCGLPVLWC
jgi:hypothetical protein